MPKTIRAQSGRLSSRFWRLLGASTEKNRNRSLSQVTDSSEYDEEAAGLTDEQLRKAAGLLNLDDLAESEDIPQFLAIAKEAAGRATALRPFDVQLLGALRMLAGDVIEMATGEGKTLSGAIAAAGYALAGRHVHVVTINDYLARRDAEWMSPLIEAMGLTVGWITAESTSEERRAAYGCDVTYASVNEIGFDVLRDQLVVDVDDLVSPNPDVALIDEADSVLVDEALVPLVLAGTTHRETPRLEIIKLVGTLDPTSDFETDSDSRNVHLTDAGARKVEKALGGIDLYSEEHVGTTLTEVNVALHAHVLLQRDVHYIVRDDAVHLINSSRGRIAQLQRWPDGLQAAVEAKEGIETTETGEVLDTITVQALINRYETVCGMTGTALAAGEQLRQFYKLGVSPIPPNKPNIREDESDRVYITAAAKNDAIVAHIAEVHETGQPVLVGTRDVAESEELHERLLRRGVPAVVLNAKNDAEEAEVIAEAGKFGVVTVSTQMAGRGTDIRLGGSDEADHDRVAELGGLHVVGTGRHHTERLDNQLRGPLRPPGRPRLVGVLLELGRRCGGGQPRPQQAAHGDRRGRPDRQPQGGRSARPRPARRRGPDAGRARQHLALQPVDRPAARHHRRSSKHVAAHHDRARGTRRPGAQAVQGAGQGNPRGAPGEDLPADHALSPRPRLGRSPGLPGRHPRKHPPAGAGPAEPAG